MYIKFIGLYHLDKDDPKYWSYYQKIGQYCFQLTANKDYATNLTQQEVDNIFKYKRHYCQMYGASDMIVVSEV